MKSKLFSTFSMLRVIMVAALTVFCVSCDKTETTDSTGFILHYLGVTDIGPSMSYTLKAPTYKGSAPYDFTITNVTLNDETYNNEDNFVINAETGEITIQNTETMSAGLYNISVGCYSNGNFYNFKDAVQVNMLLAVPEGVTVEPAEVLVNQDEENWVEASAQVTTEKDKHVSITNYAIAQDESKPYLEYFSINNEGKITIKSGTTEQQLIAGESYTLSLKLTTKAGEHMYTDAVTFKVVAKPRNLFYIDLDKQPDLFEAAMEGKSIIPTIEGAKEELKFSIKSITPEASAFCIDETTGQISLPEGHTLPVSSTITYVFTITASNAYGSTDFEDIYSAQITDYIAPIDPETFNYDSSKLYQLGGELNVSPKEGLIGGVPTFSFAQDENHDEEIIAHAQQKLLTVDSGNGTVHIANTHTLSAGTHEIKIRISNKKNEEGFVRSLTVTVLENPNYFTYVDWGTNIENELIVDETQTTPINTTIQRTVNKSYMNQFRFIRNKNIPTSIIVQDTDLKSNGGSKLSYRIDTKFGGEKDKFTGTGISPTDGTITMGENALGNSFEGGILLIEVTANHIEAPSFSRKIPVFFNAPKTDTKPAIKDGSEIANVSQTMICTPFVVKVNPKTGECSSFKTQIIGAVAPSSSNDAYCTAIYEMPTDKFVWDYYGPYSYCNFDDNPTHLSSKKLDNSSKSTEMLYQVWDNCNTVTKTNRTPMRYYNDQGKADITDTSKKAGYLDAKSPQIVIIPEKWKGADGKYAYGAMLAQIKYNIKNNTTELVGKNNTVSNPVFPLIIWFDETYEGN